MGSRRQVTNKGGGRPGGPRKPGPAVRTTFPEVSSRGGGEPVHWPRIPRDRVENKNPETTTVSNTGNTPKPMPKSLDPNK